MAILISAGLAISLAMLALFIYRSLSGSSKAKVFAPVSGSSSLRDYDDESVGFELARRVKDRVELAKTRQIIDNITAIAESQYATIPAALPAEVKPHPATGNPSSPKA